MDFRSVISHTFFAVTFLVAICGWWTAFIGQCVFEAKFQSAGGDGSAVGTLWFAILLQLALIVQIFWVLATDTVGAYRIQISVFLAIATIFAVLGTNSGIFNSESFRAAIGAGWLLLAIVDILWLLYMSSEEDTMLLRLFNSMSMSGMPFSRGRGSGRRSQRGTGGAGSLNSMGQNPTYGYSGGVHDPSNGMSKFGPGPGAMMTERGNTVSNIDLSAAGHTEDGTQPPETSHARSFEDDRVSMRAKALYAYTASPDDPNEIGFQKGEILDIIDSSGKWWQARKSDGTKGIVPSNYLSVLNEA